MAIIVNLDVMMAKRKMSLNELSARVGITLSNLSILKTGKAKAIKFATLDILCDVLDCEPSDIIEYRKNTKKEEGNEIWPVEAEICKKKYMVIRVICKEQPNEKTCKKKRRRGIPALFLMMIL